MGWKDGNATGKGSVHFKNGDSFFGEYVENKKCGPGVYKWADGAEESGDYENGAKVGWHSWRQEADEWNLLYDSSGGVTSAKRTDAAEARLGAKATSKRPLSAREQTPPWLKGTGKQLPRQQAPHVPARLSVQSTPALRRSQGQTPQIDATGTRLKPASWPQLTSTSGPAIAVG